MDMKESVGEVKRNDRFLVEFPEGFNLESWSVSKINKPKFSKGEWENIKITFIDPIHPSTSEGLKRIMTFLTKNKGESKVLFDIDIKSLDTTGEVIETWIIQVEKVLTINFGELDYGSDTIQHPFIVIEPFDCQLNKDKTKPTLSIPNGNTSIACGINSILIGENLSTDKYGHLLVKKNGVNIDKIMTTEEYRLISGVIKSLEK